MADNLFVLVAAGANPPLSTKRITDFLLDWKGAVEPGSKPEDASARPFFRWLANNLSDVFPVDSDPYAPAVWTSAGEPNFEELLHVVERLTYLLHIHYYDMMKKRLPPYEQPFYILSTLGETIREQQRDSLFDILVWASNAILDFVADFASRERGNDSRTLISTLLEQVTAHVYSLNYDTNVAIEGLDWYTGFEAPYAHQRWYVENAGRRQVFHSALEAPEDKNVFAQLHGSVNFGWIEHEYRAPYYVIARYPEPPNPRRTPRRIGFEHWNDRSSLPAMPMITGFRKAEKILIEPYATYYHWLRTDAFKFNRWLIMGYGGGDPHINAILQSAAEHWQGELRAYVCNLVDVNAWSDERRQDFDLRKLATVLGRPWRFDGAQKMEDGVVSLGPRLRWSIDGTYSTHSDDILKFYAK